MDKNDLKGTVKYQIDPIHSTVTISVTKKDGRQFNMMAPGLNGTVTIDYAAIEKSSATMSVPISRLFTGNEDLTGHILQLLNYVEFGTASLETLKASEGQYLLKADDPDFDILESWLDFDCNLAIAGANLLAEALVFFGELAEDGSVTVYASTQISAQEYGVNMGALGLDDAIAIDTVIWLS